ncbi:hypothetical protein M2323_002936 [Rhodoblastus acidophilus]|uniref:PLxRFG domain-containing protein n=1 Tax=Rhodoblastus acidophilus TaxID=1074 RepID=UPI002224F317|nr:PLxRFG domain-containing protein [Rhodoblastus acidophilus]MCW2284937.1 hypothetical protein [Rhodoblastus acidophilus]MCW2333999.1 hypothetical protein [Rhodoblastus acidophilus]
MNQIDALMSDYRIADFHQMVEDQLAEWDAKGVGIVPEPAQEKVATDVPGQRVVPSGTSAIEQRALDQLSLAAFRAAAEKYNVPADVLIGMAEKDSGLDPFARSRGPGAKTRGMIKMTDEDVAKSGVNPYVPEQNIDYAARKLATLMQMHGLPPQDAVKAFAAGNADPASWGPDAHSYADDVLARTQRITDTYFPAPAPEPPAPPAPVKEPGLMGNLNDARVAIDQGLNMAVQDIDGVARKILPTKIMNALDAADRWLLNGKTGAEVAEEQSKKLAEEYTPKMRESLAKKWWDSDKSKFGDAFTDWRAYSGTILQSMPETLLSSGPALKLAKGAFAASMARGATAAEAAKHAATVATVAGAATEGLLGGAQSEREVRQEIEKLPFETLRQSDAFKAMTGQGMSEEAARKALATDMGARAFITGGIATGIFGGMGDRIIAKTFLGRAEGAGLKDLAKRLAGAGLGEGLAEELPQSALQQLAQNEAVKNADPNKSLMDDVVNQGLGGAVTGAVMGVGMGGAFHGATKDTQQGQSPAPAPPPPPATPSAPPPAPAPTASNQTVPLASDAGTPPSTPSGPLSAALAAGAPDHAPLATIAGKRVMLNAVPESFPDHTLQMAGHIVGQDADGVLFLGDDGVQQLISHEELAGGTSKIVPAPDAPHMPEPRFVPREEGAAPSASAEPPAGRPKPQENQAIQPENTTSAGTLPEPVIEASTPVEPVKESLTAETPAAPAPAEVVEEPSSVGETATAKAPTVRPLKQQDKPLSEMSEPELRERMKFLADQGKASGWSARLTKARRDVEREIDARKSPAGQGQPQAVQSAPVEQQFGAMPTDSEGGEPGDRARVPGKAAQPSAAEFARLLAEMSEPEFRQRLKAIATLARSNGSNRDLVASRREVETEINRRRAAADEPTAMKAAAQPRTQAKATKPAGRAPKASVAPAAQEASGLDAASLREHMERGPHAPLIAKMIDSGKIVLHDDHAAAGEKRGVQGFTMPDGTIHLVARHLRPDRAYSVLLHEAFHAGAEPLVGSQGWRALMSRVQAATDTAMERALSGKAHTNGDFWRAALDRAQAANAPAEHMAEEVAAYIIENAEAAPRGLREAVDSFVGHVKAWALRRFGKQLGDVTPSQLRSLALAALRSWDGKPNPKIAKNGARYSIAGDPPESGETTLDGIRRRVAGFMMDRLTGGNNPETSALGLIPTRPLFMEIAKHLPSARRYLDSKTAMDTMRNDLAQKTDDTLQAWFRYANKMVRDGAKISFPNRKENQALMDLMHEVTREQVDPSKPWRGQERPISLEDDEAAAREQRREEMWGVLKDQYDALSPPAKVIFNEIRDSYKEMGDAQEKLVLENVKRAIDANIKRAQRRYADDVKAANSDASLSDAERADAIDKAKNRLAHAETIGKRARAARLKRLRAEFERNRLHGPYFPLARFGNYFVTVRNDEGRIVSFSKFESETDRKRFAREQSQVKGQHVETGLMQEGKDRGKMVDPRFMENLDAILDDSNVSREVRDQVWQRYLESLPDMSMRKHRIHRKGTMGFNTDALRAYAHTMFHAGHQMSRLKYGIDLQEHLDEMHKEVEVSPDPVWSGAIEAEARRTHDFIMNPIGATWAHRLTSFTFLWTMAFNVSSAIVNIEQTFSKGGAVLAYDADTQAGVVRAMRELASATADFMRGRGFIENSSGLADEERSAIQKGYESGVIDKTQAHDLASISETGVSYNPVLNMVMKAASAPMHHTERANREVTFLAAYRIARKAGLSEAEAVKKASDLTWMSHYDNQASSKARAMRGDMARVIFALKSYQVNVLFRAFRDLHQSFKGETPLERKMAIGRFTTMVAMSIPMAGLTGMFMMSTLMSLASFFMGLAGGDDEPEESLRRIVLQATGDSLIGKAFGGMLMDGVPGWISGTALSDRIGNADLWFRSNNYEAKNADEVFLRVLEQLFGATIGLTHQMAQGAGEIGKGNTWRGVEKLAPAAVKNPMKAARYAYAGGVLDKNGNPVVENLSVLDLFKQFLGFTPAQVREQLDRNTYQRNQQNHIHEARGAALREAARARMAGDEDALNAAMLKVDAYNERYPEEHIRAKDVTAAAKRLRTKGERMEHGVDLDDKLEDRIGRHTAPSVYGR